MLSRPKHSTGDVRQSSGNMIYDDIPEQQGHSSLDYSGFDYMQSNNSSFDSQPPPAPPTHGYRDPGYMPSENLDSEPASDEETMRSKTKKSFSNLFQKKKNNDDKKQRAHADRKGRSRAASRASQVSTDGDGSFTQPAFGYYAPSGEANRAKQFGRSPDHPPPPPMLPQDSYTSSLAPSLAPSTIRTTTPASGIQEQDDSTHTSPSLETTTRQLKTRSLQDPKRALAELHRELTIKKEMLEQYHQENHRLMKEKEVLYKTIEKRDVERQKLLQNFDEYLTSVRATPDTLKTISDKIQLLKATIKGVADELGQKADKKTCTKILRDKFWVNMEGPIGKLGNPLKRQHIIMLTEKYIMDQLVESIFCLVSYPGLAIDESYSELFTWVEGQDERFATRLRQEMARVVATRTKGDDTDVVVKQEKERVLRFLCQRLALAFPFIMVRDKEEPDPQKRFVAKFRRIVDQAFALSLAMKGQEVDITTGQILVGEQEFDASIMEAEQGKDSGVVQFCIYPPFIDRTGHRRFLEKAKVYCS
ncbi:hypothetical protein NQZ79_g2160 [Umbelopsis isabellina]|nr:hypothetical protein NQZ79_g2160 [Umbelopsis isabellina]